VRHHRHTAWKWFRFEIARQLGQDGADALFAEYSRRAKADKRYNDRLDAPELLAKLESRTIRVDAVEQRRLTKRIARLKALLEETEEEA
jgi:hypothetical protein